MKPRLTMPKSGKLVNAYDQGGEEFRKYCLRYGNIETMKDWDDPIDGKPIRLYRVIIDGLLAKIRMKNGEVYHWGYGTITQDFSL